MKLTTFRSDYRYTGNGQRQYVAETLILETDGEYRCHFDSQTRVLQVKDASGHVLAAVTRVDYFHVGDVTVVQERETETP